MRVNELSRELGKTNKEVLDLLKKQGYDVKSHSSNINSEQIDAVRQSFAERPAQREQVQKERTGKAEAQYLFQYLHTLARVSRNFWR